MHTQSLLSNKKMNLDKKVWLVMLITSVVCLGLVSYKVISKEKCVNFTVNTQGLTTSRDGNYEVGEPVFFRASLATDKEIAWDFGDNSEKQKSRSVIIKHTYIKEGVYFITATANGACLNGVIKVNIKKAEGSGKPGVKAPKILGNTSLKAGQSASYVSDLIGGSDYEWKILDRSTFPTINEQSAKYTFTRPGIYRIQLTVDHDRNNKRAILEVNVTEDLAKLEPKFTPPPVFKPIPPPKSKENTGKADIKQSDAKTTAESANKVSEPKNPPVVTKRNTQIGNRGFKTMLQSVVAGETRIDEFDEYLFSKGNTIVKINDENGTKKFIDFFYQIKGKKYLIEDVKLVHDPNDETIITRIEVKLKDNRSALKRLFGGKQE